ncbi:MAG: PTS sugar transporter subunit IIA [Desulfobacter sp.]|nr:MAG: PTS sugar transporter subunit IIA [Desulfobacter sp.]
MTLSITDLCSRFGVAPATVERWIRQGKIPSFSRGGSFRFREQDIDKWAARQNIRLNRPDGCSDTSSDNGTTLVQAFESGAVYHDIKGADKDAVLSGCVERMAPIPEDFKQDVLERIQQREAAMSTGIGSGVAIPHSREPLPYLRSSMIITCFPESPVPYDALDGKPVKILFFLLSTSLSHHLPLLSALSKCMKDGQFLEFIDSRPGSEALLEKIQSFGI